MKHPFLTRQRPVSRRPQRAPKLETAPRRWVRDDGYLIFLTVLFWVIFYQNLPDALSGGEGIHDTGEFAAAFAAPSQVDRIIKISMIAAGCYLIAIRRRLARKLLEYCNPGLLVFTALMPLSMIWSIDKSSTLLRFISEIAVLLVCFGFVLASWHPRRFQQVAIPPILLVLLASLAIGAVAPNLMIEVGDDIALKNSWHGLSYSKNGFGMLSGFGVVLCAQAWLAREKRPFWPIVGTAVAFLCLTLSRSNTSMFATLLAVFTMYLLIRVPVVKQRYSSHIAIGIAVVILIYELSVQKLIPGVDVLLAPIVGLTGKDTTFSARTHIWQIIKDHIQLSPYWGTGYGAYWVGPIPGTPSYVFMYEMYIYPTESHNGYLEVVNDLGMIGLACLIAFLGWYVRQALQLMRTDRNQAVLYLGLLYLAMTVNMSESDWFSRTDTFATLALASLCLSRGLLDAKIRHQTSQPTAGTVPAVTPDQIKRLPAPSSNAGTPAGWQQRP